MNREKTLKYIKDMISPSYFEDAVAWALDNCDLDGGKNCPHLFGDKTPLQNAFENYLKYLLAPKKERKSDPAVVCIEYTHHELYLAGDEGDLIPDNVVDSCWDDDPTYRVIDEGGFGEWLEWFYDFDEAKKFCEDYNKEHAGE